MSDLTALIDTIKALSQEDQGEIAKVIVDERYKAKDVSKAINEANLARFIKDVKKEAILENLRPVIRMVTVEIPVKFDFEVAYSDQDGNPVISILANFTRRPTFDGDEKNSYLDGVLKSVRRCCELARAHNLNPKEAFDEVCHILY